MKKTICVLIICSGTCAYSQVAKGRMLLNGALGYTQNSTGINNPPGNYQGTSSKISNISASCNYGYFISDHVAVGVSAGFNNNRNDYSSSSFNETSTGSQLNQSYAAGVFMRYYKMFREDKFGFFCQATTSYEFVYTRQTSTTTLNGMLDDNSSQKQRSMGYNVSLRPGFTYFPFKKFGIEASVGTVGLVQHFGQSYGDQGYQTGHTHDSRFSAGFSTAFTLGLTYYF